MGQQQSQTARREPVERRPPSRPIAPPTARPVSDLGPKGPSYHNPVNKVLPAVLPTKHQLRPVSQEMSKIIPNYKDIYAYDDDDVDDNEDNNSLETNHVTQNQLNNGQIPQSNGSIPNGNVAHSETGSVASDSSSSGRTPSVSFDPARKYKVHRRQQSATSSLYSRENTIVEDPKESLELRGKLDSMSMSCPQVSIPVRSTFDMDSSLNMTYAQFAEARRNKTLSMIEQKTGKRIEDLSNDLSEHTSRPVTNLVRSNSAKSTKSMDALDGRKKKQRAPAPPVNRPPAPPAPLTSKSAPSTPRGPIRSKSQQAPQRPANPPPVYMRSYSVHNEPPVDYDMEEVSIPPPPPLQGILKTSKSYSKSRSNSVEYADEAYSNGIGYNDRQVKERKPPSRTNSQRVPPIVAPIRQEDPLLLEIQKLAEKKAARRQMSEEKEKEKEKEKQRKAEEKQEKERLAEEERMKEKAAEKEKATEKEKDAEPEKLQTNGASNSDNTEPNLVLSSASVKPVLQKQDAIEEGSKVPPPPVVSAAVPTPGTSTLERKPSTTSSSSSADSAMRRLSSLLQHDIKVAAQAKATKIVKKSTKVKEKPKDPAEVFREQLAKAASDREQRSKTEMTIDELMKKKREEENNVPVTGRVIEDTNTTVFKSEKLVVKKKEGGGVEKPKEVLTLDLDTNEYPKRRFEKKSQKKESKIGKNDGSLSKNSRQRVQESESEEEKGQEEMDDVRNSSIYTREDWTPCDDLDSDDNLSDKDQMMTSRGNAQGFKSTIVPNKVNDLKIKEKKGKGKENKYTKRNSDMGTDERRKYDSIKRFKKSVHKSVKNAFGSISKAGGKIIKKQKSEDLEVVNEPPPPPNWKLRSSVSAPQAINQNFESEQALKYMVPHGFSDHNSDSSDAEVEYSGKMRVNFGPEEDQTDEDEDSEKEEIHQMKRAGVAYIGKKGQIVVLPEYENVPEGKDKNSTVEFEGHAPKIYQKKKKFTYDNTVRKKDRLKREEILKEEVKREEEKREEERQIAEAKEKEIEKVREMEARERLQRLETQAQLQQQLLQQQQMGILSAPPLPPPAGFQQGYNASMDYSHLLSQANLPQTGYSMPFGSQPMFSAPVYPGMPNMSLEDLSQYMRMMSMQGTAPNPQQQYAFMLNSVNLANQGGFDRMQGGGLLHMLGHQDGTKYFKTSSQEYLDSDRNQVFNNWVGPTKQPASKATIVPTPQIVQSSGGTTVNGNSVTVSGPRVSTHSGGQIRTNIMVNDDESDTSDGLSPQNAALASATNAGPTIISGFDGDGGHRTKISVSGSNKPRGCNRQTSFSSVSSQPGSETSAER